MAAHPKPGRNDRCPCGSGKKYKNCCASKAARKISPASVAAVVAIAAAAGVLLMLLFNLARGGAGSIQPRSEICPPGQVWDPTHNHCH
jgi:SEC-C motif